MAGTFFYAIAAIAAGVVALVSGVFGAGRHAVATANPQVQAAAVATVPTIATTSVASPAPVIATTTIINYITQPVIERIVKTGTVLGTSTTRDAVTHAELQAALNALRSDVFSVTSAGHASSPDLDAVWHAIALTNKIDSLPSTATIGGSLIASQSYVTSALGSYLPLSGGTMTGALVNSSTNTSSFAGKVGIGTTTPTAMLQVQAADADPEFKLYNSNSTSAHFPSIWVINFGGDNSVGAGGPYFQALASRGSRNNQLPVKSGDTLLGIQSWGTYNGDQNDYNSGPSIMMVSDSDWGSSVTGHISFNVSQNNIEAMHIADAGNIGMGTSSPWRKLSVTGTVGFDGLTGSTGAGSLCLSATKQVVYNSASDACLSSLRATKHDIQTLTVDPAAEIAALVPVSFIYNEGDGRTRFGFIAEDTEAVDNHLATHDASGAVSGIDDRAILSVIVGALQHILKTIAGYADNFVSAHVTATNADFDNVHVKNLLCVGSTCLTEAQVQALLRQIGQTSAPQQVEPQAPTPPASDVPSSTPPTDPTVNQNSDTASTTPTQ